MLKELGVKEKQIPSSKTKARRYVFGIFFLTTLITIALGLYFYNTSNSIIFSFIECLVIYVPISEIVVQTLNYFLSKIIKPKTIPKLDFSKTIPKEYSTFVVIPTILNSKEKVKELINKLEIYYLANKSENIYFALLGDCTSSKNKMEKEDEQIINTGLEEIAKLNKKYHAKTNCLPTFHFLYRERTWNDKEECYLGWERKRGLLCQLNKYLIDDVNCFLVNTISDYYKSTENEAQKTRIKYVITLDSDTNLILGSANELVGAMAHILNRPVLNATKDSVIEGHGIIQPRVGLNLDSSNKTIFSKLYAGTRRNRFIYKCYF